MADILIKGMEMPDNCFKCRFAVDAYGSHFDGKCVALGYGITFTISRGTKLERHMNCPLVEIPEHGRLIDADAFIEQNQEGFKEPWMKGNDTIGTITIPMSQVIKALDKAPTIVEKGE